LKRRGSSIARRPAPIPCGSWSRSARLAVPLHTLGAGR